MSATQEQVRAVLGQGRAAGGAVRPRDFRQPQRMDRRRVRELSSALESALPALERRLAESFGLRVGLALERLGEVDCEALFAGLPQPLAVLRFRVQGEPAWLAWEPAALIGSVETVLGAKGSAGTARKLSPTEVQVASSLLGEIARGVGSALELAASDFALVQAAPELGSWREGGEAAEPHRLEVQLAVKRGQQASALRVYLPGIARESSAEVEPLPAELPAHLQRLEVELSAQLGGCEVSLEALLALEEGDVIPLDARLGDPALISVAGLELARARLGSHRGRLAVRIERICVQREEGAG